MRPVRTVLLPSLVVVLALVGLVAPASAKAKPWKVTASPDRVTTTPGVPVTVTGKVKPKAAKKKVRLQVSTGGGWSDVATVKTTKKSRYTLSWAPSTYGSYTLRVTKGKGAGRKAGSSPTFVLGVPKPVVGAVRAGGSHACALVTDGTATCWGDNGKQQLGRTTATTTTPTPGPVAGLSGATDLATGYEHTCAVARGTVYCWGDNSRGQLGLPTSIPSTATPTAVALPQAALAVAAGNKYSCAVLADRTVSCWGTLYATSTVTAPAAVSGLTSIASISAGNGFTCAVTTSAAARCWGVNDAGQLGNGGTSFSSTPVTPTGLGANVASISAGYVFACALTTAGAVLCWGTDSDGEVGNGSTTGNVTTPTSVITGQSAVSTGSITACSQSASTGRISCWGDNLNQDLGVTASSGADITSPTAVASTLVATPVLGGFFRCALDGARGVWCWGDNFQDHPGRPRPPSTDNTPARVAGLP